MSASLTSALVQRGNYARHPLLHQVPNHIRRVDATPLDQQAQLQRPSLRLMARGWEISNLAPQSVKDFLLAYCACFVAFSVFFA